MLSHYQHRPNATKENSITVASQMLSPLNRNTCDHFSVIYITKWKTWPGIFIPFRKSHSQWTFSISTFQTNKSDYSKDLHISFFGANVASSNRFWLVVNLNKVTESYQNRTKDVSNVNICLLWNNCNYSCTELVFYVKNYFEFPRRNKRANCNR